MNTVKLCFFSIILLCAPVISQSVQAAPERDAEQVVRDLADSVLDILQNDELETEQKLDQIVEKISPVFDFPLMAKLTLGRTYWPQLTEEQQKEFTDLFIAKLKHVYTKKVEQFSDEKVTFEKPERIGSKVHIKSFVISKGDRISLNYKLYKAGDSWRIYDLEVQDVSIVNSYRSQFTPIIRDKSANALLQELRESVADEPADQ